MIRHRSRDFVVSPSAERVTDLRFRYINYGNAVAVIALIHEVLFSVNKVPYRPPVYRERTVNPYVVCRHSFRYVAPTAERVAFFFRLGLSRNLSVVFGFRGFNKLIVNIVAQYVGIDLERTVNPYADDRHCCRNCTPAAEGVTFFFRFGNCNEFCSVIKRLTVVKHIVDVVFNCVLVDCEYGVDCNVACGNCLRNFRLPSLERVSFFGRFGDFRRVDCFSVFVVFLEVNFPVNI